MRRHDHMKLAVVAVLFSLLTSWTLSMVACGQQYTYVYVYKRDNPSHWIGKWFNSYYAGAFYVDLRTESHGNTPIYPPECLSRAYCIDYDGVIHTETEYKIDSLASPPDDSSWRAIAYLLTWYDPPADDTAGVWIQGALWKILDGSIPGFIPESYRTGINNLFNEATGKDVARQGDKFEWISPQTGNPIDLTANPGDIITLKARITHQSGGTWVARSGVKVQFSAIGGGSLDRTVDWTNNEGIVEVKVTVPSTVSNIQVKASTRGVWPEKYVNFFCKQDLLCYELTVTTNLWIIAYIHVIPELPFGTLAAVATFFAAYMVKAKRVTPHLHR